MTKRICEKEWITAEALWYLRRNERAFVCAFSLSAWLEENLPTLAAYLPDKGIGYADFDPDKHFAVGSTIQIRMPQSFTVRDSAR